jgi:hypothetical protein
MRPTVAMALAICAVCTALFPYSARALPSFARQTSQECSACHTIFPQLTPFGRKFKRGGYVLSSGESDLPHVAGMVQGGFTHTEKGQPGGAAAGFDDNDNFSLNEASLFYGGIVVPDNVGAFIQGTYEGVERQWSLDNTDIRFANSVSVGDHDVTVGITANNNPTVSDSWNSTPVWGFPYSESGLMPEPTAGTLIQGGLEQQVAGVGGYAMVDDHLYAELEGYMTLPADTQRALGVDPTDETEIDGVAPYWRIAYERGWGSSTLEVGHFGLTAATYPGRDQSAGTDRITDLGLDSEYQYIGDRDDFSLLTSFIVEDAKWDASRQLGLVDNSEDMLYSFNVAGTYIYDKTYSLTVGYFDTFGDTDAMLYGTRTGSPDTSGFTVQLDWLPINKDGGPSFWSKSNLKVSLQYTAFMQFDGATNNYDGVGHDAADNNTLYLQLWLAL